MAAEHRIRSDGDSIPFGVGSPLAVGGPLGPLPFESASALKDDHLNERTSLVTRLEPGATSRVQLVGAAVMWMVGAAIMLTRGLTYLSDAHWALWIIAVAGVLGVIKGHAVMQRSARKGVERIRQRDGRCFFGFFSWRTWLFIAVMMTGGILLRSSGLDDAVLAIIYLAVATGLIYADTVFWSAALRPVAPEAV